MTEFAAPHELVVRNRRIEGISATLLPFDAEGNVDYGALAAHVARTADCGLTPAVNMDTGYVHLLNDETRARVLDVACETVGENFVAGAFVRDVPGAAFNFDEYARQIEMIQIRRGTPVIFQSFGIVEQQGPEIVASYEKLASACDRFIGFELTTDLAPFGSVYDLDTYAGLMQIPQCIGAKHSSFRRQPEWDRLALRNRLRPDFKVFTGNDFAIDMVMYGSDYLLGLSTFAPDLFAERDRCWESGDARFYELNDWLQYLGMFAFRHPGPAYKHTAAQFLRLRKWIQTDRTHPESPMRPDSDIAVLADIASRMDL